MATTTQMETTSLASRVLPAAFLKCRHYHVAGQAKQRCADVVDKRRAVDVSADEIIGEVVAMQLRRP